MLIVAGFVLLLGLTWLGVAAAVRQVANAGDSAWLFGCVVSLLLVALAGAALRLDRVTRGREVALDPDRGSLAEKTAQLEATLAGMSDGIMMVDACLCLLAWTTSFPTSPACRRRYCVLA